MKKWEQLQLTVDNSKSEEGQGDYQGKTQKLFKTMTVRVMKYEFQKVLPWKGLVRVFDLQNVFNKGLYGVKFIECSSYRESIVFMNLSFTLFMLIVVVKIGCRGIQLESVSKTSSKQKEEKVYSICLLKVNFQGQKNPQKYKNPNNII